MLNLLFTDNHKCVVKNNIQLHLVWYPETKQISEGKKKNVYRNMATFEVISKAQTGRDGIKKVQSRIILKSNKLIFEHVSEILFNPLPEK